MEYKERVPKTLFRQDGHYMGRPADFYDKIIGRRVNILLSHQGFVDNNLDCLEIGCGNGASLFMVAPNYKSCTGIDINPNHEKLFHELATNKNITNCEFRHWDICKIPIEKQYDRLVSFEVIEHLDTEDGIANFNKALKLEGLLAITVPNKWWIFEVHGAKLPLLPWNRVPFFSWLPRFIHERYANARIYTKKRIHTLLKKHGFEILYTCYVTAPMDVLPEGAIKRWLIKNFFSNDSTRNPFKATSIFVLAKKVSEV